MSAELTRAELFALMRDAALSTNDRDVMFQALVLSEEDADDDFYSWAERLLDSVCTLHVCAAKDVEGTREIVTKKNNVALASYSAQGIVHRLEAALTFARQLAAVLDRDAKKAGAQ